MKKFMSTLLAGTMIVASCSNPNQGSKSQKPVESVPAKKEEVKSNTEQIDQSASSNNTSTGTQVGTNAMLTAAVSSMMKSGDVYLKDFEGKDVSIDEYKVNPNQYYLVFKKAPGASSYRALNTTVSPLGDVKTDKRFNLSYKIYDLVGEGSGFKGANLGTPVLDETLSLDANPFMMLKNKDAIFAFFDSLKANTQLASNKSFSGKVSDFLFPTAYADDFQKSLLITAIVFTSVSGIAYLFSFYTIGTISAAGSITFWLLYFFYSAEFVP
jgi:hypothetical protein